MSREVLRPQKLWDLEKFSVALFGPGNWSLAPLQKAKDAEINTSFSKRIAEALAGIGATRAYAPNVVPASGVMVNPEELTTRIPVGNTINRPISLWRNKSLPADGTLLNKQGHAGVFSAGGCPMIVMSWGDKLAFAHAGRDSLLDRNFILGGKSSRQHESVVDALIAHMCLTHEQLLEAHVWVFWSIRPEDFLHPFDHQVYGEMNEAMANYVGGFFGRAGAHIDKVGIRLDLPQIIKTQCIRLGLQSKHIYLQQAYLPEGAPTTRTPGKENLRSLIAVVRH